MLLRLVSVHHSKEQSETIFQLVSEGTFIQPHFIVLCSSNRPLRTSIGKIKHRTDSVYAFEDVLKAYEKVISSRAVGKVIVEVPAAQPPASTDPA